MGTDFQDIGLGGIKCLDLWGVLQIGHESDNFVRLIYMGDYPPDRSKPAGFPPQGGPPVGGDTSKMRYRGYLGISSFGSFDVSIRPVGVRDVHHLPPENHLPIYRNSSDI